MCAEGLVAQLLIERFEPWYIPPLLYKSLMRQFGALDLFGRHQRTMRPTKTPATSPIKKNLRHISAIIAEKLQPPQPTISAPLPSTEKPQARIKLVRLSSKPLPLGASYQPFQIGFTETSPELNFGSNLTILKFWTFILDGAYY